MALKDRKGLCMITKTLRQLLFLTILSASQALSPMFSILQGAAFSPSLF